MGRNLLVFNRLRQANTSAWPLSVTETTTLPLLLEQGSLLASELPQLANITPPSMAQAVEQLQI